MSGSPKEARLAALLVRLYTVEELRRALRQLPGGAALLVDLPEGSIPRTTFVDQCVDALKRRRGIGDILFRLLRNDRPELAREIDDVAADWKGDDPLRVYREQLRVRADLLATPFVVQGGPEALSQIYVNVEVAQDLPPMEERGEGFWSPIKGELRKMFGRAAVRRSVPAGPFKLEAVARCPGARWAVLGDPGCGKTTLLRNVAARLLDRGEFLPILFKVTELEGGLASSLERVYGAAQVASVLSVVQRGAAVLLLDGLDEALDPAAARSTIVRVAAEAGACPLVLTSRPVGFQSPSPDFEMLTVCPLGRDERRRLLLIWVDHPARVDRTLVALQRNSRLRRLSENPLLLTLVGILLREGFEVPSGRGELYDRAIRLLLARAADPLRTRGARELREPELARQALGWAALQLHGTATETHSASELQRVLLEHPSYSEALWRVWGGPAAFFREVAETTALLVPGELQATAARVYAFPHRTFREYLAAVALCAQIPKMGFGRLSDETVTGGAIPRGAPPPARAPGELGRVLQEARPRPELWAEVLTLCYGMLGEEHRDGLLRRVAAEGSGALTHRLLAEAEGVSPETIMALLGLEAGWANWEARARVIMAIPDLVHDPADAVGILNRYRQMTTDGNDLYWIRHSLFKISEGEGDPDVRQDARDLGVAVLNHLPIRRLMTLEDELADWWTEIPPGSFTMGSVGGDPSEAPPHTVRLLRAFEMLCVPVTWAMYLMFDPGHIAARASVEGRLPPDELDEAPVFNVTWYAAQMFAEWVSARLPMEAEWEYACRAGTDTPIWSGARESDLERIAWYENNSGGHPHPVMSLPGNPWGLFDLCGNVWEWCLDLWEVDTYAQRARGMEVDPRAAIYSIDGHRVLLDLDSAGSRDHARVYRGGSCLSGARDCRASSRSGHHPSMMSSTVGFRLVRPL